MSFLSLSQCHVSSMILMKYLPLKNFIFLLTIIIQYYSVNANSNWLLESIFTSKPIYYLKDDIAKFPQALNDDCRTQLDFMLNQQPLVTPWAINMFDSNAHLPSGLLRQQFTSVGSYKQCMKIHSHHQNMPVNGQFCFLTFTISNSTNNITSETQQKWIKETFRLNHRFRYAFGLCIPDSCSKEELSKLFQNSKFAQNANLRNVRLALCQTDKEQSLIEKLQEYNNSIAFPILIVAISFAFLGTFWHIINRDFNHWLMYFSIIKSTKVIFNLSNPPKDSLEYRLRFLHGIRFIAMFWIFVAHAGPFLPAIIVMPISYVARHPYDIKSFINQNLFANIISNGFFAVQTFFFISGFLMTSLMIKKNHSKTINFITFTGLRWLRFSIPLLGAIVLQKIMFMIWKGPFFTSDVAHTIYSSCRNENIWKNFFFITNFTNKSCIRTSWYLSCDLQIHIIAFVLVFTLRRSSYKWLYILSAIFASMSITIPLILLLNGFSTMDITAYFSDYDVSKPLKTEIQYLYFTPYMHMGAFFYGAILGTLLLTNDKFFQKYERILFYASLISMIGAAFYKEPSLEALNYNQVHRGIITGISFAFWNLGLGMICFQLALPQVPKHAIWLSNFLVHPFHRPISRLSFSIYLTQFTVLILNFSLVEDVHNISLQSSVTFSLTCLVETIIFSWCLFVLFESPIHQFVKSLISQTKKCNEKIILSKSTNTEQELIDIERLKL